MFGKNLDQLAEEMQRITKRLLRTYQLRDRKQICCFNLSVSQCYTVDALGEEGVMTMRELAFRMDLDRSTMTRIVDQLVKKGMVARHLSEEDRRICCVRLTKKGHQCYLELRSRFLAFQKAILEKIPSESREQVIEALQQLHEVTNEWRQTCC